MANITIIQNPLEKLVKTSDFGMRWGKLHRGVDLGTFGDNPDRIGVYAVAPGIIHNRYDGDGYGYYTVIEHDNFCTLYGHMQGHIQPDSRIVQAGALLGYMGNTGSSQGTHLHFEIRIGSWSTFFTNQGTDTTNTNAIDPMTILDPSNVYEAPINVELPNLDAQDDGTLPLPSSLSHLGISSLDEIENITDLRGSPNIYHESLLVPRRVADSGTQPFNPFVEIYVADQRLIFLPPNDVISLEFNRLDDSGSDFILTIFDKNWGDVEALLSNNFSDIKIRYGIVNGLRSKTYNAQVTDYSLLFNTAGPSLTVKGVTNGVIGNFKSITLDTNTRNPTDAAKRICEELGWLVLSENFEPSENVEFANQDTIALLEEHPASYIKNHLAPIAISAIDGESGYSFYLDDTTDPPTAHFKPRRFVENANKTYVYMRGIDSPIIDLQLDVNGVFGGATFTADTTTEIEASFIDPNTKETKTLSENLNSVRITSTGTHSHTRSDQLKTLVDAGGLSSSNMNALIKYRLKTSWPYKGTVTLVGDPDFDIADIIRLIILTDDGNLHHTSGLYLVLGITDNISNGVMTTSLEIFKCEDIEEGVELVNYRTLLK